MRKKLPVTAPSYERYLEEVGPYEEANAYIQELADELGVTYWDFNLCKKEYLNLKADSFIDVDHLNGKGAQEVTTLLAELNDAAGIMCNESALIDGHFNSCYDIR